MTYASGGQAAKLSIHVGLTRVDPNAYQGWGGWLVAPARDAQAMAELARANGFEPIGPADGGGGDVFVDGDATWTRLCGALADAAGRLEAHGQLLVTFSGHGGEEARSRTSSDTVASWVLYDREVTNDEVVQQLAPLADRPIVVVADCCSKAVSEGTGGFPEQLTKGRPSWAAPVRSGAGDPAQAEPPRLQRLVFLRACQPHQTARDGPVHSLFTETLLDLAWAGFAGSYRELSDRIDRSLPAWQTPRCDISGETLEHEPAFPVTGRPPAGGSAAQAT